MFDNIPSELKEYKQWVTWRYEVKEEGKKPTKVPYSPLSGYRASVQDRSTWGTFDEAVNASMYYDGIGFVLTSSDPFAFIDLDDTGDNEEARQDQIKIFEMFNSYSERSPSGKGLHIIVKGSIPSGKKFRYVEIYSKERYMTMTGDVWLDAPIAHREDELTKLWAVMQNKAAAAPEQPKQYERPQLEDDLAIIEKATQAENGEKFDDLLNGNWQKYNYPSQSEADQALVNIISFYTKNREQIARIFKNSVLGHRNKQTTIKGRSYIDYMIDLSFDRDLPPVNIDALQQQLEKKLKSIQPQIDEVQQDTLKPVSNYKITMPDGLIGEIAKYVYDSSPRPVSEIALASAIALVSGICGRCYNISGTGLNQYIVILAKTGTGKEAASSGISRLMRTVNKTAPHAFDFIGPSSIASQQGLIKRLSVNSCFLCILGEFGLKLQEMTSSKANAAEKGILKILLDIYNKSGKDEVLGAMAYSDTANNVSSVVAPSVTILGDSTPETFYEAVDEYSINTGLIPRLTIVEYEGDRPPLNKNRVGVEAYPNVVKTLAMLINHAKQLNSLNQVVDVEISEAAEQILDEYDKDIDRKVIGQSETLRQIWTRAHIKALKLAAVVAIGINPYKPVVNADIATWAVEFTNYHIFKLIERFESGHIGIHSEQIEQEQLMLSTIKRYLSTPFESLPTSYRNQTNKALHLSRLIPHSYLRLVRTYRAYKIDKQGAENAFKRCLASFIDSGIISLVRFPNQKEVFGTNGKLYSCDNLEVVFN